LTHGSAWQCMAAHGSAWQCMAAQRRMVGTVYTNAAHTRARARPKTHNTFHDHPEVGPTLTPAECIHAGIFGGCYCNPEGGKPGVLGRHIHVDHREFPPEWFSSAWLSSAAGHVRGPALRGGRQPLRRRGWHRPGGISGGAQGWIDPQDPRGWFQWYCRFYAGRRTADDIRQIRRWSGVAGPRGRWRRFLMNKIGDPSRLDDETISPVVRQPLLHWAYELKEFDFADNGV
jgi:hypothetical protein